MRSAWPAHEGEYVRLAGTWSIHPWEFALAAAKGCTRNDHVRWLRALKREASGFPVISPMIPPSVGAASVYAVLRRTLRILRMLPGVAHEFFISASSKVT